MKTPETPGMRRWTGGPHRYFVRWAHKLIGTTYLTQDGSIYNVPDTSTFILGEEMLVNTETDERHQISQIEFRSTDAQILMDNIALLNGMPSYTAQLQRWALLETLVDSLEEDQETSYKDEWEHGVMWANHRTAKKIRELLKETK